ncbi:MAG: HAD-IA family hydrolase [Patescibacteria group bacterium]
MIRAICFDLDGVYFLNGKENFIFALRDLGISEDNTKEIFLRSEKMGEYKLGKISDIAFWTWAARQWRLNKSPDELIKLLISGYQVNLPAVEYIRRAKKIGYKALACTNNFPARILGLNDKFHFLNDFDCVVTSYEAKALKPERKIFERLVLKSQVLPHEIVMADDDDSKLKGARELGINTFLYKGFEEFVEYLARIGVEV